jgi:hypothetical protein
VDPIHHFLLADRFFKFCLASYVVGAACNFLQISFADISKDQGNLSEAEKVAQRRLTKDTGISAS